LDRPIQFASEDGLSRLDLEAVTEDGIDGWQAFLPRDAAMLTRSWES